jgi:hypothetical protein
MHARAENEYEGLWPHRDLKARQTPRNITRIPSLRRRVCYSQAANEDIPHFYVRKSGMLNIIGVLVGLVSHGG